MKQEKEKELWGNCDIEKDMSWNMYQILVNTAVSANLIGTICNFCIHGTELPTILCGVCLLMILIIGCAGWITQKVQLPAVVIILILSWFEFPYLYYCYGNTAIVYLILGIVGLAVFFPRSMVIASYAFTLLEYLVIMMISFERPSRWSNMDEIGIIGTTLGSFIIVALSVFAANHDPLTRLYNRRYLVNQVNEWICKPEKSFWIVLMDVDEFKAVNDTYGHGYGDDVLREAGRLMLEEMMGKGIAARFGGEEFMLVFEQDDRDQVLNSFRNIQEGLRRYSQNTRQTDITISGGMERYEADKQLDLLFTSVDRKLYIAKNNGKNRIVE